MTDRQLSLRPDDQKTASPQPAEDSERRFDLSATQVAGGALAAMTTAALGSRLGIAGTIAGAALASVIAAVAGALYTASLRSTHDKVKTVWRGPTRRADVAATVAVETPADAGRTEPRRSVLSRLPRASWRRILVSAVAVFGLAGLLLTGYEAVAGQALSGGTGTTVEQVSSGRQSDSKDDKKDAKSDSEESADPSASADESSEPEPAESEPAPSSESEPSSEPAPSSEPDAEPTEPAAEPTAEEPTDAPEAPKRQGAGSEAAN